MNEDKTLKKLNDFEIKRGLTDTLSRLDEICILNNIKYFLAYGTLLGSVRHSGFIPWDDDIDVLMPRTDYLKLIKVIKDGDGGSLNIICPEEKTYYAPFAEVYLDGTLCVEKGIKEKLRNNLGLYIDIFPMDGIEINIWRNKIKLMCITFLNQMLWFKITITDMKRLGFVRGNFRKTLGSSWCVWLQTHTSIDYSIKQTN